MPNIHPKISIITCSFNQGEYIEDCISSILDQGYPNLEYIIVDGGSTDKSLEVIRKYENYLSYWVSEKDNGLYDGLKKGFFRSTGEIMGWLNSDDILHYKSLFSLCDIFSKYEEIDWIQGYPTIIDREGRIVSHRPHRFSPYSFYLKDYHDGHFIQQESTYWRRRLWEKSGSYVSTEFKYAGDFELWMRFFRHTILYTTDALIGAFRMRGNGQISSDNYNKYMQECDQIIDKELSELPSKSLKNLRRIQWYREIKNQFPRISNFFSINRRIDKRMNLPKEVNFDFKKYTF